MSRTDDRACLVGGTCIKWKPHYPCLDGSSGVAINQPRWLRGHRRKQEAGSGHFQNHPLWMRKARVADTDERKERPEDMDKWLERKGWMKGKETLHQKAGGREDSDGSSRTASLEVVCCGAQMLQQDWLRLPSRVSDVCVQLR